MNNKERKTDYERSANEIWRWIIAGNGLLEAANYLQKAHDRGYKKMMKGIKDGTLPEKRLPSNFGFDQQVHYLQGKCLEVYLKAARIKYGEKLTDGNGNLEKMSKTHKLNNLCDNINFKRSKSEKETLDKLTDAVEFWGTYPVPINYLKWRPDSPGITGIQPIYSWREIDNKNFSNILLEIIKAIIK